MHFGAYYFPGYHSDPRTDSWHGVGWTEWDVVATARPRYSGHQQPKVPAWGPFDESEPVWAQKQSELAAEHGIDFFIFDWYWYQNGPFLNAALDRGYLAPEVTRNTKFALMWANHDWMNIHPSSAGQDPALLLSGIVTNDEFDTMAAELVNKYFTHLDYFLVDGKPYFSIYQSETFTAGLGSTAAAAQAIARLRDAVSYAGLPGLHLNLILADRAVLPGEATSATAASQIDALGADSTTSYVWIHHVDPAEYGYPQSDYPSMAAAIRPVWDQLGQSQSVPYFPNVTVGWDSSPRTVQSDRYENRGYPWMAVLNRNSPAEFETALISAIDHELASPHDTKIVTINAWNEWTEGSYLLPDTVHGLGYLEACRNAKASRGTRP